MKRKFCFLALPCLSGKSILGTLGITVGIIITCLFFNTGAYPQGLSVGDKIPEVTIKNIIQHPTGEVKLSDFKGKLLILDFWATWCAPCVASLPKIDSLQKTLEGSVQFLPVTYQSNDEVQKVLSRIEKRKGKKITLPMVVLDKNLHDLFPHHTLPHYVWIDSEGKVLAITGQEEVTAMNIQVALQKQTLSIDTKKDVIIPYDKTLPLLTGNNQNAGKPILYQTALLERIEGLPSGYDIFPKTHSTGKRIVATNATLLWLYKIAWSDGVRYIHPDKIVLEIKDPSVLRLNKTGKAEVDWLKSHTWCYEIIIPPAMAGQEYAIMQTDLARLFPQYRVALEKRTVKCLVLVRTSSNDKLKSKNTTSSVSIEGGGCKLQNSFLQALIVQLNAVYLQHLPTPLVDLTGYSGRVDLSLNCDLSDIASIRDGLQAYDLDFVERETTIEVLVVRDNP